MEIGGVYNCFSNWPVSERDKQSNSCLCGRRSPRVDVAVKLFRQSPNPLFSVLLSLVQIPITQASGLITQSLSPVRGVKGDGRESIGGMANKWSRGLRKKCQLNTEFSSYVPKNILILLVSGIMMNKVKYL